MSTEEAKRIVSDGLSRRRNDRIEKENALEDQARQLRLTINGNHTSRTMSDVQREQLKILARKQQRAARAKAKADEVRRQMAAESAVRYYGIACLIILLTVCCTNFPLWAAIALALGIAVCLVVYIYRLYVPLEG